MAVIMNFFRRIRAVYWSMLRSRSKWEYCEVRGGLGQDEVRAVFMIPKTVFKEIKENKNFKYTIDRMQKDLGGVIDSFKFRLDITDEDEYSRRLDFLDTLGNELKNVRVVKNEKA